MRRSILAVLGPALGAAAVLTPPGEARAGIFVGAEFGGAQGIAVPAGTRPGGGFLGALGYRIGIGPVFLQPEAQGGYMAFSSDAGAGPHLARILGGARLGLSGVFQPAIYAHAGVGWRDLYDAGRAADVGLSLGLKLIPLLSFGVQAGYNVVTVAGAGLTVRWVSYGAHAAIEF